MLRRLLVVAAVSLVSSGVVFAQGAPAPAGQGGRGGRGGGPVPAPSGRAQAPYDITGYWVALVTDDWRYRMLTPPKGNADFVPVTPAARKVMDAWDPSKDEAAGEACKGYGAGGVMRLPGRIRISWVDDNTLKLETDAGTQTRLFRFGAAAAKATAPAAPDWQGTSTARWAFPPGQGRGRGPAPTTGQLVVTTTGLRPGYVRKNGIPYGANAVITESFLRLADEGDEFLAVTTTVDDSLYFAPPYIKTYEFKKQRDGSGWNPTPCSAR
ncbi:MAG TPA: hypothetical protein VIY56_10695 [Vicinamibacterales bacterium]